MDYTYTDEMKKLYSTLPEMEKQSIEKKIRENFAGDPELEAVINFLRCL